MPIFNVDKFLDEKTVIVEDKRYTVKPLEVKFWAKVVMLEKKEKEGTLTQSDLFTTEIEVIKNALPDLDVDTLPIQVVEPLFQFIVQTVEADGKKKK